MEHPDWLDELFGYLGSSLLIISLMPQIYKSYSTKKLEDLSALTLGFQLSTASLLLTYSIIIKEIPMIYGNSGVLLELILLCFAKWKYRPRQYRPEFQYRYYNSNSNIQNTVFDQDVEMNINDNLYDNPNLNNYEMQTVRRRHSSSGSNEGSWLSFKNIFSPIGETSL